MDLTAHDPHHHSDAHAEDHGHDHHDRVPSDRPGGATLNASYVVAFLLAGLLIAAVNFIGVMSSGHHDEKATLHHQKEATSNESMKGETGTGLDESKAKIPAQTPPPPPPAHDAPAAEEGHGH